MLNNPWPHIKLIPYVDETNKCVFYSIINNLPYTQYSHASLNDGDTFWEMRRQAISSLCERHRVYLHKPRQYSLLHT
jgi:hypothetical protein